MAIPQEDIRAAGRTSSIRVYASEYEATRAGAKSAFLSYSQYDRDLAMSVEEFLRKHGWNVYVDWNDPRLPEKPSRETAEQLQLAIRSHTWFLFLATENSCRKSRWCPWEIGYADKAKGKDAVVIMITEDSKGEYGTEFLDLYKCLDETTLGEVVVRDPRSSRVYEDVRAMNMKA